MIDLFDEYQVLAWVTAKPLSEDYTQRDRLSEFALGCSDEGGEVAGIVKKALYHGHPLDVDALAKELGDVLWYVAALATTAGLKLGDVAERNIAKLKTRYPEGFSAERSINREG